jgi:Rrf2 family transcriptional regulator, iron-sulfur cluster assembly transcription factor
MLSNTCKYAIRAVIYLAVNEKQDNKIGIRQIATELDIPSPFLGKILQVLSKNKLLNSSKGPNGGFSLGRKASQISLLDIVKIIDGMDFFDNCIIGMKVCSEDEKMKKFCPFHESLDPIRENLYKKFKSLKISSFKKGIDNLADVINL